MSETSLVKKMKDRLKKEVGGKWIKIHGGPYQEVGLPDLIGCVEGLFIGIEAKLPGREENLTPKQRMVLDEIEESGGLAIVSSSVENVLLVVKQHLRRKGGAKHGKKEKEKRGKTKRHLHRS